MNPQWKVRTSDGTIYGPAHTETVKNWLRERRITPHDQASLEGTENWQPISVIAEFQNLSQPPLTTSARNRLLAVGVGAFALICIAGILVATFVLNSLISSTKPPPPRKIASTSREKRPTGPATTTIRESDKIMDPAKVPEATTGERAASPKPFIPESVQTQAAPEPEATPSQPISSTAPNLVRNGDFSDGFEAWDKFHSSNVDDRWDLLIVGDDPCVSWSRKNSRNDGGSVGVVQTMDSDVSGFNKLFLSIDIKVKEQGLLNPGWWSETRGGSGEYPVKIILFYEDAMGKRHMWTHGFLSTLQRQPVDYTNPENNKEEHYDTKTTLSNYTVVPRNEWYRYEVDLLERWQLVESDLDRRGRQMPRPHRMIMVRLVGEGWDFAGSVDNISLRGE